MENKAYIYSITDNVSSKIVYIGQHNGNNKYYGGSSLILMRYKKKYGTRKFRERYKLDIIEYCEINELNEREIYYIKFYNTFCNGFNLTEGGYTLAKSTVKGKSFPLKNEKLRGLKRSLDTISLMKEAKINFKPSSLCHENNKKVLSKPILQYDKQGNFIREWDYVRQPCDEYPEMYSDYNGISCCCMGKQRTANDFIWVIKNQNQILNHIDIKPRKEYKKGVKRIKNKSIEIQGKQYNSITEASRFLGWSFGKLNSKIKKNQIEYKWIK